MAQHLFLIDPAAVGRLHLQQSLTAAGFEIMGTAADPGFAWPKLQARWPDVIVFDIEWPRLDVAGFLKRVHAERPTPVVVCAAHLTLADPVVQTALAAGAAAFPKAVDPKYSSESAAKQRMKTCLDQYNSNKAANANGGLNWIQKGGGYYSECNKRLKG